MADRYVSIAEYSRITGTSLNAVYKNKGLKPYIEIDSTLSTPKKVINLGKMERSGDARFKTVLNLFNPGFNPGFNPAEPGTDAKQSDTDVNTESPVPDDANQKQNDAGKQATVFDTRYISLLEEQIKQKDEEINSLLKSNADLQKTVQELTQITTNAQQLQANMQGALMVVAKTRPGLFARIIDMVRNWWNYQQNMNT